MNWFKEFWKALTVPMPHEAKDAIEPMANFTPRSQQVLTLAREEAARFHHNFVGTEHLLLGLIRLGQGTAVKVLGNMGLNLETVRREVERQVGTGPDQSVIGFVPYTPRVKKVLALAAKEAKALNHTYVGTEHILLGLLREGDGVAARVLQHFEVNIDITRQEILKELDPNYQPPNMETGLAEPLRVPVSSYPALDSIDTTRRYDVYCAEQDHVTIYRNALFKSAKKLFPEIQHGPLSEFVELEQADGQTIFVARSSIIKFSEHSGAADPMTPAGEGERPREP